MPIQPRIVREALIAGKVGVAVLHGRAQEMDWLVREDWADYLFDEKTPRWLALAHATDPATTELVKLGDRRTVWRVVGGGRSVYAKVFAFGPDADEPRGVRAMWLEHLKIRLIGNAAEREWQAMRVAERRGIGAARAVALGVSDRALGRAVLLSEAIEGAGCLTDVWERDVHSAPPTRRLAASRSVIEPVAELLATAHQRGLVHRDGHPHNILVRTSHPAKHEALYVDLLGAAVTSRLASESSVVESLAQLDQYFHRYATRGERLRFLRAYSQLRSRGGGGFPAGPFERYAVKGILRARTRHAVALAKHRDRRIKRSGKYFTRIRFPGGWRGIVVVKLERRHVYPEPGVADREVEDWIAIIEPAVRAVAAGESPDSRELPDELSFEAARAGTASRSLVWGLLGSPARRSFEACHRKRHRDQPAELILGYLERRPGALVDAALLIRPRGAG